MLSLKGLTVGYPGARGAVLSGIAAEIAPSAFICVLGRNGSGKSTLMRTIAGLQSPLHGEVWMNEAPVHRMNAAERAKHIAVVLTERASSPGLTSEDVVSLGRQPFTDWQGRLSRHDHEIIVRAFDQAGASAFRGSLFDDLSDGERQRVMIARAIAQTPRLMVLDEITAFLDLPGRVEIMSLLRRHGRETGAAILLSSHDLDLSLQLADEIWLLDGKGGLKIGAPDALSRSGAVGEAFDTPGVAFSPDLGRFELRG